MVVPRSFTSRYKSRTLESHVGFIIIIDSCDVIFAIDINAPMCILVGECPPIGKFLVNYFSWISKPMHVDDVSVGS
jgi:hypothetical protein